MPKPTSQDIVTAVIETHGVTFCRELGITIEDGSAGSLFQLLCASLLFTDRIDWMTTLATARLLKARGWTQSPQDMAAATYDKLLQVLREGGYVLYNLDEVMARRLTAMTSAVFDRYNGDLNNLRERAGRIPEKERDLLGEFEGMGDIASGVFFREAQGVWDEIYPYLDSRSVDAARELGLPADAAQLAQWCSRQDFTRLAAGLVRVAFNWDYESVISKAEELEVAGV